MLLELGSVKLNVGGRQLVTSVQTLLLLLGGQHPTSFEPDGSIFIDRSGDNLDIILGYLRDGQLVVVAPNRRLLRELWHDFIFFGIDIPTEPITCEIGVVIGGKDPVNRGTLASVEFRELDYLPGDSLTDWVLGVPSLREARSGFAAVVVGENIIYVLGGVDSRERQLLTVEVLFPRANTFVSGPPLPASRFFSFYTAGAVGPLIYAFGHRADDTSLYILKLDTGDLASMWTEVSTSHNSPSSLFSGCTAAVVGTTIFLIGNASMIAFDTGIETWSELSLTPVIFSAGFTLTVCDQDTIFILAFDGATWCYYADCHYWEEKDSRSCRVGAALFTLGDCVHVAGGQQADTVEFYDRELFSWTHSSTLREGRSSCCAVIVRMVQQRSVFDRLFEEDLNRRCRLVCDTQMTAKAARRAVRRAVLARRTVRTKMHNKKFESS
jgi:hypothetical protein